MASADRFGTIAGVELYRRIALGRPVIVVDVRTPEEFAARHVPGSRLIPLQELEERLDEVPRGDTPVAVVSEEGRRSRSACTLLAEHGYRGLFNLDGGLAAWPGPFGSGGAGRRHRHGIAPSSFLVACHALLPRGLALDVTMGDGRNAIYLATRGYDVDGVDPDPEAVARARVGARKLGAPIRAVVGNFEDGTYRIGIATYDLIVVFNYVHRPLFRHIRDGVVPGGAVVYQSFTRRAGGGPPPIDPEQLLEPGELKEVFRDWEILCYRELTGPSRRAGDERTVAGIVARKPS